MLKNIDIQNYRAIKQISLNNFANINIWLLTSIFYVDIRKEYEIQ